MSVMHSGAAFPLSTVYSHALLMNPCDTLDESVSQPVSLVFETDTSRCWSAFDVGLSNRKVLHVTSVKRRIDEDIPSVGGLMDDCWEIDMGTEVVRIPKARDPLADLRSLLADGTASEDQSAGERAAELRQLAASRLRERSKRQ